MVNGNKINGADLAARIPDPWREPTLAIARALGAAGHRAWVVGGTVRDLILDRPVKDVDIVSSALPDQVEALFEKTIPVGKAFGIVVVVLDGLELEVATFREETGYSDQRRPDSIRYAPDSTADARRRDFTCNALFLDPLDGTLSDPTGGLQDLAKRQLQAVGDAADRFREDGLRLLRLARFSASLGLDPAPGLLDAARAERASLAGVSAERVLGELGKIFAGDRAAIAIQLFEEVGIGELCLPGWGQAGFDGAQRARRIRMLAAMDTPIPIASGLAVLVGDEDTRATQDRVAALRGSKDLREAASVLWAQSVLLEDWAMEPGSDSIDSGAGQPLATEERGRRVLIARMRATEPALAMATARATADGHPTEPLARLKADLRRYSLEAPEAPFELPSQRLIELGIPKGPALGLAIARMRAASLGGAFLDAPGAEEWLLGSGLVR